MPKKRTAAIARDRDGAGLMLWSRGRKGPLGRGSFNPASFDPASQESLAALGRTLDRTAEVMVKVTGGGRDAGTAEAHINYIDRQGELDVHTDDGEILNGKDVASELVDDWALSDTVLGRQGVQYWRGETDADGKPKKDYRAKLVHNIVLSMPRGTPPDAVLAAAKEFARENFALSHRYAMVLHDPATDPKHEKTQSGKNPHVHLVVKAVSETGQRLYIRKDTLQAWREQFAQALRFQGVEANATPAAIRGKPKSSAKSAIHQHQERIEQWRTTGHDDPNKWNQPVRSTLLLKQVEGAFNELYNGAKPGLPGKTKLTKTREKVLQDWLKVEKTLRERGMTETADRVVDFINNMPAIKTGHDLMKERILADTQLKNQAATQQPDMAKNNDHDNDLIR